MIDILFTFAPIITCFIFAAFAGYLVISDANEQCNRRHKRKHHRS